MNPSTDTATALVRALVATGVEHVVLCPGSRSAPLAFALHAADAAGVLTLHVRHDERAAAFTALGLALGSVGGQPAAVVTTSGTAVANLHPAVLEAHEAGVPLLLLTADRPAALRGTWANQTTPLQAGLFGAAVRLAVDLPAATTADGAGAAAAVRDLVAASRGRRGGPPPGPVHLNVAFDEPLVPTGPAAGEWPEPVAVRRSGESTGEELPQGPPTVVLAGAGAGARARQLAEAAGWPLLAEPSSGARGGPNAVGPYRLLLADPRLGGAVERIVVLGRPTLSRPVTRLLARGDIEVVLVGDDPDAPGPARTVHRIRGDAAPTGPGDPDWLCRWRSAGSTAAKAVDEVLDEHARGGRLTGPLLAREVAAATGRSDLLVAAASNPVRDLDLAAVPWDAAPLVLANRGLSGVDGTLSTAVGAGLAAGRRGRALVGDLAFLHDLNGLLLGPGEPEPDLQVVVLNDDGGGIFGLLEYGEPRHADVFERVFGTPHGADLAALSAGVGVPHERVGDLAGLQRALAAPPAGRSLLEVRAGRAGLRDLHAQIAAAVRAALR